MDGGILANQPLVIDSGSSTVRGGVAGESVPSTVFDAYVGRPKHERAMVGSLEGAEFVGRPAREHRGLLALSHPMSHGEIASWHDMELLWQHFYASAGLQSEDHPVLLTEAPWAARRQRETCAQVFFETFNAPACYFAPPAVLALYAAGKTTGLALDVGDGVAHCVPVYQGFAVANAVMRADLAGSDVTDFLQLLLRKQGIRLTTTAEREIVKEIKEQHCALAPAGAPAASAPTTIAIAGAREGAVEGEAETEKEIPFRLPDGQRIALGRRELLRAPEALFRPHIVGSEERSVPRLVLDAVARSDMDLRSALYETIVLSGGSTLTRGFGDRLLNELKAGAPSATKLRIFAPANRAHTTWIGGSILAGLSTFSKMWVTAEEWEEQPDRIHLA